MTRKRKDEKREKIVPFKKCAGPNCNNRCEFYDSVKKISFCRECKLNYFCLNEALVINIKLINNLKRLIIDAQEVKDTIEFIFKILEIMKNHAKVYNIDHIYNGFSDDLHTYEERMLIISNKITDATESTLIEKYACINKEAIDLKKELDLSQLMHNFLKHQFQITLNQSVGNSSEYSVENEIYYSELSIKSKKEIEENYKNEYNAKLEKEKEIIDKKYRSELDKLTNQVNEFAIIVEKKNEEILSYISKNRQIEEEKKNCEVEIESLKEKIQSHLNKIFDFYRLKT